MDWKSILERDGPTVWRAAYRLLGNAADADDCLQEAAIDAVEVARREPVLNWRALLTRLVSARAMDQLRRRGRNPARDKLDDQSLVAADRPDPGQNAHLLELKNQLRGALTRLSPEQAAAFCLCALEGWSYAEAAEHLKTPASTVGVLVHRARQHLRELLKSVDPTLTSTRNHQ